MITLEGLLAGSVVPSPRRLASATAAPLVVAAARRHGRRPALVDGLALRGRDDVLAALGDAVGAPAWWGRNWDALLDVLADPELAPAADVLVWSSPSRLHDVAPAAYVAARDILLEASRRRRRLARLDVLLCDARPLPGFRDLEG